MARVSVESGEDELGQTWLGGGKVQASGKPAGRTGAALAQRRAALEHQPEVEQALLVQVTQGVVLGDVEHRRIPTAGSVLEVPRDQPDSQRDRCGHDGYSNASYTPVVAS